MPVKPNTKTFRFPFAFLFKSFLLIIFVAALFWAWHLIKNPRFMPIQNIQVQANYQHVDGKTISDIIMPYVTGQGLFSVDVETMKQALLQQSWIYAVFIKRIWPNTLEIQITEQQPFAVWNGNALLNVQGDLFTPAKKTFPANLPMLNGPEGQEALVLQQFRQWNSALQPLGLSIAELDLNERLSWRMHLNNNIVMFLGRSEVIQRFNRFLEIYPKALAAKADKIKAIDLRYPDGLTVEWSANNVTPAKAGIQKLDASALPSLPAPG